MTHQKQHKYLSVKNKILVFTKVTMDIKLEKTDHNDEKSLYFMLTIQYLLTKKKRKNPNKYRTMAGFANYRNLKCRRGTLQSSSGK